MQTEESGSAVAEEPQTEAQPALHDGDNRPVCVLMLSGGLDSSTLLAIAKEELGFDVYPLFIDYGQRALGPELRAAIDVSRQFGCHNVKRIHVDLAAIGGSSLVDKSEKLPGWADEGATKTVASSYVPARNTILLAVGLGYAEVVGASHIFLASKKSDYYPDQQPEYLEAFTAMANMATRDGQFTVEAPLQDIEDDVALIKKGIELGVDYKLTYSCYEDAPDGRPCGICSACVGRRQAFLDAGMDEPRQPYANPVA